MPVKKSTITFIRTNVQYLIVFLSLFLFIWDCILQKDQDKVTAQMQSIKHAKRDVEILVLKDQLLKNQMQQNSDHKLLVKILMNLEEHHHGKKRHLPSDTGTERKK